VLASAACTHRDRADDEETDRDPVPGGAGGRGRQEP
jgi:hypothetical protein